MHQRVNTVRLFVANSKAMQHSEDELPTQQALPQEYGGNGGAVCAGVGVRCLRG